MTIEEAVQSKLDRFNRLFTEATGHTFEEDPEFCEKLNKKETPAWKRKLNRALKSKGFETLEEYKKGIKWDTDSIGRITKVGNDEKIDEILSQKPNHKSLFGYDKMIHDQVIDIVHFIEEHYEDPKGIVDSYEKSPFDFVKRIQEDGFEKWDDGHSGNSGYYTVFLVRLFYLKPDMFQYTHGALALLVGDEGYHDDRSDVPQEL